MNPPLSEEFKAAIAYFRGRRYPRLRFSPRLEAQFEADESPARCEHLARTTLWMIVPNALLLLNDFESVPEKLRVALLFRLVAFPILAVACSAVLRSTPHRFSRGLAIISLAGTAALMSCYLYAGSKEILSVNTVANLLLILLATNLLLRLRWRYSLFCAIACLSTSVPALWLNPSLPTGDRMQLIVIVASMASLMLLASYVLERDERFTYLLLRDNELNAQELVRLNQKLAALSSLDGLTGIANRISFDNRLEQVWRQTREQSCPLSVIMIDIDHFKFVNDTQGHLYGDEVIKRVATLVQGCLRGPDDFLARYGGEEFVVILPREGLETARTVAERICTVVRVAGSPPTSHPVPKPDAGLWTTVSCGVATIYQAEGQSPKTLLQAADDALYQAKAEGRDRVCCTERSETEPWAKRDEDGISARL